MHYTFSFKTPENFASAGLIFFFADRSRFVYYYRYCYRHGALSAQLIKSTSRTGHDWTVKESSSRPEKGL